MWQDGIPLEYTVSIGQWLTDNGYGALFINLFEEGMVQYGSGDISETPAVCPYPAFLSDIPV